MTAKYPKWRFYQRQQYRRKLKGRYPTNKDDKVLFLYLIALLGFGLLLLANTLLKNYL